MNIPRLMALKEKNNKYAPDGRGICKKHPTADRWVGSGSCCGCKPRDRGSFERAIKELYGVEVEITYKQALLQGLPMFNTGKSCKHGHGETWRYVSTPQLCNECNKDAGARLYQKKKRQAADKRAADQAAAAARVKIYRALGL